MSKTFEKLVLAKFDEQGRNLTSLNADVSTLKSDVTVLKSDVTTLKADLKEVKVDVHRLGVLYEDMNSKIDKMLEVVEHNNQVMTGVTRDIRPQVEDHEHRIAALESYVKER